MTEAPDEYDDDRPEQGEEGPDETPSDVLLTGDPAVDEVLAGMDALHAGRSTSTRRFRAGPRPLRKALDPDRESV